MTIHDQTLDLRVMISVGWVNDLWPVLYFSIITTYVKRPILKISMQTLNFISISEGEPVIFGKYKLV
jgi:hypothetical protein